MEKDRERDGKKEKDGQIISRPRQCNACCHEKFQEVGQLVHFESSLLHGGMAGMHFKVYRLMHVKVILRNSQDVFSALPGKAQHQTALPGV